MEDIKVEEIWKDIKGYEGLYQVSNFGRIKSLERVTKYRNSKRVLREKIKGDFIGKRGYKRVELTKDGKYIKIWESAVAVERELGIKRKSISQCVTGHSKTAGGYKWVLYEQFESMKYDRR